MKRILVPCDFSSPAKEAYKFAASMAAKTNGEVLLLHVINIPVVYDPGLGGLPYTDPTLLEDLEAAGTKNFEGLLADQTIPSIRSSYHITNGDILSSILEFSEEKNIDLIIMGTTGSTGLAEIFIGSNTEKVVRHAQVPVLAVRHAPAIEKIKNILLPSTLSLGHVTFMNQVKAVQDFFQATLHVLLINTPSRFQNHTEASEALKAFAKHYQLKNYQTHLSNYSSETDGIIEYANEEQVDLVLMGTHARTGLGQLFKGSITERVVNRIQYPVWTCHLQ
jgi:nucleotide-binding universal stress UspA family protein